MNFEIRHIHHRVHHCFPKYVLSISLIYNILMNDVRYAAIDASTLEKMDFDKRQVNRKIIRIASPIALQGIVSATLTMVDNLMVGMLGETELAAVGVAGQIFMIHYLILFGFVSGAATFLAQFYGAKDMSNIRKVVGFAITAMAGLGLLFFTLTNLFTNGLLSIYTGDPAVRELASTYVRINSFSFLLLAFSAPMEMAFKSTQQVRIPLIVSTVVFSSNTLINYILIFGKLGLPALGVAGAAVGTISARTLEFLLNSYFAFRDSNEFKGKISSYFGWNSELIKRIVRNATPTTINEFFWSVGQTMYVAAFNRIGTTAYAAFQAANAIFNIFNFASFSVGDAALILVGEKLGEGDISYSKKLAAHLIKVSITVGLTLGLLTVMFAKPLSGIFRLSADGKTYMFYILLVFGITMVVDIYTGMQVTGILRAGGDTRFVMFTECGTVWLVAVPLAFLAALVWHLPIHLALLATRAESVVKAVILTKRYLSGKWANTVIRNL